MEIQKVLEALNNGKKIKRENGSDFDYLMKGAHNMIVAAWKDCFTIHTITLQELNAIDWVVMTDDDLWKLSDHSSEFKGFAAKFYEDEEVKNLKRLILNDIDEQKQGHTIVKLFNTNDFNTNDIIEIIKNRFGDHI